MRNEIGPMGVVLLIVCAIVLASVGIYPFVKKSEAANSAVINNVVKAESEQVKIFSAGVGDMEKLEKEVNAWLKENDGKIYVYARTQSGTQFAVQVAVWYKVKK